MQNKKLIIESKEDQEKFKNWILNNTSQKFILDDDKEMFANSLVKNFIFLKPRIKSPYNDFYYWMKNSTPDDLKKYVDELLKQHREKTALKDKEKDGARLVYSDNDWKVYEITNYEASAKYGKNTKWCISGSKEWENGENGEKFFDGYYNQNGIKFYFFIKSNNEKWALAVYPNNEYCEIFNAEDVKVAFIPGAPEIPEIKVKYNDNSDSNILVNAIMSGQLDEKLLIDLMADVITENTGEMCSIFNNPDDMVYFVEEYIPEGYLEYEAVESGAMTPEEYEEITGEEYIEGGWSGDIPAIDLDDIGSFDTKDEYLDRTIYEAHKFWVCTETGSWYGYSVYNADDWVHLYLLGNDLCRFQDWPDEDVADFYNGEAGGSRADMLGVCMANLLIDKIKKGEVSKNVLNGLGLSESLKESREDFFKNSVVRDASGNLLPVYHCSFSEFDTFSIDDEDGSLEGSDWSGEFGFAWFAEDESYAQNYGDGEEYECYLNITHPLDIGELNNDVEVDDGVEIKDNFYDNGTTTVSHEFIRLCKLVNVKPEDMIRWYHKWWETGCIYDITRRAFFKNIIVKLGYDGVIATEGGNKTWGCVRANQIKLISNENPTEKDSMKESLDGVDIYTAQGEEVLDILKSGKTYVADYDKIEFDYKDEYRKLAELNGFTNCPIFAVPAFNTQAITSSGSDARDVLLHLRVPRSAFRCHEYYDWSDYIFYSNGGGLPEENPEELMKELEELISQDLDMSSVDTPELILNEIKPEWLVGVEDMSILEEDLSKEQEDFFKDSVIRDKSGKLIPMWHGTNVEFSEFNGKINWFSSSKEYAKHYAEWLGGNPVFYEAYLNCKKPFNCGNTSARVFDLSPVKPYKLSRESTAICRRLGIDEDDFRRLVKQTSASNEEEEYKLKLHAIVRLGEFAQIVKNSGYDSIFTIEEGHPCVGVLNPEDIKRVTNLKPTSSKNIDEEIIPYRDSGIEPAFTQEDIIKYAKNDPKHLTFGLSEGASVVLSDGTTINVTAFDTHGLFAGCVYSWTADLKELGVDDWNNPNEPDWDGDADEDAIDHMYSLGVVTLNDGTSWLEERRKVVFEGRPTERQFDVIRDFIDMIQMKSKASDELYVFNGANFQRYKLGDYTSDEIIKKIKKSFITGRLEESEDDEDSWDDDYDWDEYNKDDVVEVNGMYEVDLNKIDLSDIESLFSGYLTTECDGMNGPVYIFPDGTFLDIMNDYGDRDSIHYDIAFDVISNFYNVPSDIEENSVGSVMDCLESTFGMIRCNGGEGNSEDRTYISIGKTPTEDQYEALKKYFYNLWQTLDKKYVTVMIEMSGFKNATFEFDKIQPEEIIKAIRRYFISGQLLNEKNYKLPTKTYDFDGDKVVWDKDAEDYIYWGSEADKWAEEYANSYKVQMSPKDFLDLTTQKGADSLKKGDNLGLGELRDLDKDEFNKWINQPIFLQIAFRDKNHPQRAQVVGHEGRHRMFALMQAGYKSVDVELSCEVWDTSYDKYHPFKADFFQLIGQFNKNVMVQVYNPIPLSWKQHKSIRPDLKDEDLKEYLETVALDDESEFPVYATDNAYQLKNLLTKGDKAYRIYEDDGVYYFQDAAGDKTHYDMLWLAKETGWLSNSKLRDPDGDDEDDLTAGNIYPEDYEEGYMVFIPTNYGKELKYHTKLGDDSYYNCRVYDFGVMFVRDTEAYNNDLFSALGEPEKEIYYDSWYDTATVKTGNNTRDFDVGLELQGDPNVAISTDVMKMRPKADAEASRDAKQKARVDKMREFGIPEKLFEYSDEALSWMLEIAVTDGYTKEFPRETAIAVSKYLNTLENPDLYHVNIVESIKPVNPENEDMDIGGMYTDNAYELKKYLLDVLTSSAIETLKLVYYPKNNLWCFSDGWGMIHSEIEDEAEKNLGIDYHKDHPLRFIAYSNHNTDDEVIDYFDVNINIYVYGNISIADLGYNFKSTPLYKEMGKPDAVYQFEQSTDLQEKIVKKGSKWQVQSEKGKNLGTYDTKKEAEKRLGQIEYFKHLDKDKSKQRYYRLTIDGKGFFFQLDKIIKKLRNGNDDAYDDASILNSLEYYFEKDLPYDENQVQKGQWAFTEKEWNRLNHIESPFTKDLSIVDELDDILSYYSYTLEVTEVIPNNIIYQDEKQIQYESLLSEKRLQQVHYFKHVNEDISLTNGDKIKLVPKFTDADIISTVKDNFELYPLNNFQGHSVILRDGTQINIESDGSHPMFGASVFYNWYKNNYSNQEPKPEDIYWDLDVGYISYDYMLQNLGIVTLDSDFDWMDDGVIKGKIIYNIRPSNNQFDVIRKFIDYLQEIGIYFVVIYNNQKKGMGGQEVYSLKDYTAEEIIKELKKSFLQEDLEEGLQEESNEPIIAYHGTDSKFSKFNKSKVQSGIWGRGFNFTKNKNFAEKFGKIVLKCRLNIENPYHFFNDEQTKLIENYLIKNNINYDRDKLYEHDTNYNPIENAVSYGFDFTKVIKKLGFDSTICDKQNYNTIVVFDENKIVILDNLKEEVDETVIAYHGSQTDNLEFRDNYPLYLTNDKELATRFAKGYNFNYDLLPEDRPTVYTMKVTLNNPYIIKDEKEYDELMDISNYEDVMPEMIKQGYDGLIYKDEDNLIYYTVFNPKNQVEVVSKENALTESLDDGDVYYRGYDSRYGIFDSDNEYGQLYTWVTDEPEYALEYAENNEYGKVAKVRITCSDDEIGGVLDLPEDVDYYDPGDEEFQEYILDEGLKGYGFEAGDYDDYCICISKDCVEVIDPDVKVEVEEESLNESKQDIEKFRQWAGDELADRFFKLKDRLPDRTKDIYFWMGNEKQLLNLKDRYKGAQERSDISNYEQWAHEQAVNGLKLALDNVEQTPTRREVDKLGKEGSEKIYEDDDWLVLKINTYEASVKYGKGTEWCITGNNSDQGRVDFNHHTQDSNATIYFFINKKNKLHKYALEYVNDNDWCLFDETDFPHVGYGTSFERGVNSMGGEHWYKGDSKETFPVIKGLPDINKAYNDFENMDESLKEENHYNVLDALDKEFGQEEVYMWSTYILPNGHFLNPDNNAEYFRQSGFNFGPAYEHCDFEDWAYNHGYDNEEIFNNCIKMNVTYPYLSMPDKARPTPEQFNAIKKILDRKDLFEPEGKFYWYDIFPEEKVDSKGENLLAVYTPVGDELFDLDVSDAEDIIRAINQAYIRGGFFTESLNESKADWEKFRQWCNDDELYNRFVKSQKRLEGKYKDIYYWMGLEKKYGKHGAIQELQAELRNIEETPTAKEKAQLAKDGTTLLYNGNGWKVFQIDTYEASRKYGKGTNWCISGDDMGYDYFGGYHDSGDRIIFFIKDDDTKYAVVIDGNYWTIYDEFDNIVSHIPGAPKVDGVPDVSKIKDDVIRAIVQLYNVNPSEIEDVKSAFDDSEIMDFFWDYDAREAYVVTLKNNKTKFMYFDGPQAEYIDVTDDFVKWAEEYM